MTGPLRILMVSHMPWGRDAGGPQVNYALAHELRARGHTVDVFGPEEARLGNGPLARFFQPALFRRRALAHVRRVGRRYDLVQAEQGALPRSKAALGVRGLLVVQSNGLVHLYERTLQALGVPAAGARLRRLPGDALRSLAARVNLPARLVDRSVRGADRVVLINTDEFRVARDELGYGAKALYRPNGLAVARQQALAAAACPPEVRRAAREVVFIGTWNARKGALDWPTLARGIRRRVPEARVRLLGTGAHVPQAAILEAFAPEDRAAVEVVPTYGYDDLPGLLAPATVSVLPSHIEGFGLGVLESLAAGIPAVAYDVPGPRDMLGRFGSPMMAPVGDVRALATRVADVLTLPPDAYAALSREALAVAAPFRWDRIVDDLLVALFPPDAP